MASTNTPRGAATSGSRDAADQWLARVLQEQPLLTAPATLEERVIAAITANSTMPWWRHSLRHWPLAAKFAFVAASIACVALGFAGVKLATGLIGGLEGPADPVMAVPGYAWARALFDTLTTLAAVARTVAGNVPESWLQAGLLLIGLLYGSFIGIGALGYRALRLQR